MMGRTFSPRGTRVALFVLICFVTAGTAENGAATVFTNSASFRSSNSPLAKVRATDWMIDPSNTNASINRGEDDQSLVFENGLIKRTFRLSSTAGTVGFDNLMTGNSLLRATGPEAQITIAGKVHDIGGFSGQPDRAYLLPEWIVRLTNAAPDFQFIGFSPAFVIAPFQWKQKRHHANLPWPPSGKAVDFFYRGSSEEVRGLNVTIHYEIYDGIPVIGKWMTISNRSTGAVTLEHFVQEHLSVVEAESGVDERKDLAWRTPGIDAFSDYMFHAMDFNTGNQTASWQPDKRYKSQVSYLLNTPCILMVQPPIGPDVQIRPNDSFTTFRSYLVVQDSTDRERQGLTIRHVQRSLAPWTTENPIMMHVRNAESKAFRSAVDQCASVGFEMIIYTFGSGLNMENNHPDYLARIKADVDYAHSKGIEVGAYSLFSSRSINPENDVIDPKTGKPGGAIFGTAPCFGSQWGIDYFKNLTNFISATGLDLLEHDGPYPGDVCASTNHPGHHSLNDSQWINWSMSARLYSWCREHGIYVNQPDYYFLAGGNKSAMGYREDNWSLPRAQQLIHARQNIYDGTWTKPQTSGWMFVPLTEYQGGGADATIEPLNKHLADYEAHLANNLGDGVQACWRGPRLYDSEETKLLVKSWVDFFLKHRAILESDIIHCRRADGRDIDYLVHVNPSLKTRAFAMVHNPLDHEVERIVSLPLYYAGLSKTAHICEKDGLFQACELDRSCRANVPVKIPAHSRTWLLVEE